MVSNNELLNALRIIKITCASCEGCWCCPLSDDNNICVVSDSKAPEPEKWKIKSDAPENNWRAFEEEA